MAIYRNTFDGGTNNVGLTTANTGGSSGDSFAAVESSAVFSNEQSHSPNLSMKPPVGAGSGYGRWAVSGDRTAAIREYVYATAAHTEDYILNRLDVNGTSSLLVLMSPASYLRIRTAANATNIWTAANVFPVNQWVRVEVLVQIGTTDGDGQMRVVYYLGDSATPVEDSGWIPNLNIRGDTGTITNLRFGKSSTAVYAGNLYMDSIGLNTGADYSGLIGPHAVANGAPVADAGSVQYVLPGSTVHLNGSGSTDPDGDPLGYAWSFLWPSAGTPALSGATTQTPSFVAGSAGNAYTLQLEVSDGELTSTDTVNILVVPALGGVPGELAWNGSAWV